MTEKKSADQGLDQDLDDFITDLKTIRSYPNLNLGLDQPYKSSHLVDIALRLRDSQHTKSLVQHSISLSNWTRKIALLTGALIVVALVDIVVRVFIWWRGP